MPELTVAQKLMRQELDEMKVKAQELEFARFNKLLPKAKKEATEIVQNEASSTVLRGVVNKK